MGIVPPPPFLGGTVELPINKKNTKAWRDIVVHLMGFQVWTFL